MVFSMMVTSKVDKIIKLVGRPSILGICFLCFNAVAIVMIFMAMVLPIMKGGPEVNPMWDWRTYC